MVNIRVLFQLMKQLLMLKRKGCCYSCLQKQRKALQLCDKGNWIPYFIFNSIHLFHEKLIVKHLSGHCRENFFFKEKARLSSFWASTDILPPQSDKNKDCSRVHTEDAKMATVGEKCFALCRNFFFQRIVVYRRVRRYLENSVQRCLFLGCR